MTSRVPIALTAALSAAALAACGSDSSEDSAAAPAPATDTRADDTAQADGSQAGAAASKPSTIATGLAVPWGIDFEPGRNGDALVAERTTGRIIRIARPGGKKSVAHRLRGVDTGNSEGGLLGLAVSPTYAKDKLVYAYYTRGGGSENRIVRFKLGGGPRTWSPAWRHPDPQRRPDRVRPRRQALRHGRRRGRHLQRPGPRFAERQDPAHEPRRLGAGGQPVQGLARVVARPPQPAGHRLGLQGPPVGRRVRPEHLRRGQPDPEGQELRLARRRGPRRHPGRQVREPQALLAHLRRIAQRPAISKGRLFLAALGGQGLFRSKLSGTTAGKPTKLYTGRYGRIRTVVKAPDGSVWFTTSNRDGRGEPKPGDDRILRIR